MLAGSTSNYPSVVASPSGTVVSGGRGGGTSPRFEVPGTTTHHNSSSTGISPTKYINPHILNYRTFSASPKQPAPGSSGGGGGPPLGPSSSFPSSYTATSVESNIYRNPFYSHGPEKFPNYTLPSYYNYKYFVPYEPAPNNTSTPAANYYSPTNAPMASFAVQPNSFHTGTQANPQPRRSRTHTVNPRTSFYPIEPSYTIPNEVSDSFMPQISPGNYEKQSKLKVLGIHSSDDSGDTYTLGSPISSQNIRPNYKYQVIMSDGSRAKVKGREISSHYNQPGFYYVFYKSSFHMVHESNVRRIKKKKKKKKSKQVLSAKDETRDPIVRHSPRIESPGLLEGEGDPSDQKAASPHRHEAVVEHSTQEEVPAVKEQTKDDISECATTTQEYAENCVHVLLCDSSGEFWAEVPTNSIKTQGLGDLYTIQYNGKMYRDVPKSKLVPIESEPPPDVKLEQKTKKSVRVLLGKKWKFFTEDKVKPSLRKPGTYVIKMADRNIRVNHRMVEFLPESSSQEKAPRADSLSSSEAKSTYSVYITDYTVFLKGKFERLPASKVRPIAAKPGFYKISSRGNTHVAHMNLVLPIVWNEERNEETVIAPTHFRVLSPTAEFIIPAVQVRPDPHNANLFIIKLDDGTYQRVKSSLLYPLWINSDTLSSTKDIVSVGGPNTSGGDDPQGSKEKNYHFRIFKDGMYVDYHADDVQDWSNRPGFYRIYLDGEWVHHPAYCISKIKHRESGVYATPVPWQDSLRKPVDTYGRAKPKWKNYYPSDSSRVVSRSRIKSDSYRKDSDHTTCESSLLSQTSEFTFDNSKNFNK